MTAGGASRCQLIRGRAKATSLSSNGQTSCMRSMLIPPFLGSISRNRLTGVSNSIANSSCPQTELDRHNEDRFDRFDCQPCAIPDPSSSCPMFEHVGTHLVLARPRLEVARADEAEDEARSLHLFPDLRDVLEILQRKALSTGVEMRSLAAAGMWCVQTPRSGLSCEKVQGPVRVTSTSRKTRMPGSTSLSNCLMERTWSCPLLHV